MSKPQIHVIARRWFQKSYGNTYHSVEIFADGVQVGTVDFAYGYGEQWLQTAVDWLKINGLAPQDAQYGTAYFREVLNGTYSVQDVKRKKDL